jgi:hypothetical protein
VLCWCSKPSCARYRADHQPRSGAKGLPVIMIFLRLLIRVGCVSNHALIESSSSFDLTMRSTSLDCWVEMYQGVEIGNQVRTPPRQGLAERLSLVYRPATQSIYTSLESGKSVSQVAAERFCFNAKSFMLTCERRHPPCVGLETLWRHPL